MLLNRDIWSGKLSKTVANRERARLLAEAMEKVNPQEGKDDDGMLL